MRWALVLAVAACGHARPRVDLTTTGEHSGYTRTGRYDEAVRLCHDFARAYDGVRRETIGTTGEGRPIVALIVAKHAGLPVIYVEAGIHAGEIEGKDAGFWFVRDLLDGKVAPGALESVSLAFVPVMSPDGHERFGKNNRPNQRGPEEMGFRTNGARLNLNRDFMKADAPETQAVLGLIKKYDPVLLIAFRGYAFAAKHSDITGGDWLEYDERTPRVWNVPVYDEEVAKVTVQVPDAGYIVDGGFAAIAAAVLDRHGVQYTRIEGTPQLGVSVFRATKVSFGPSYEGRTPPKLEGAWTSEARQLDAGALFVPINQPLGRLAVELLEPEAPDSLTAWGLFDTAFEQKEYIEPYVLEPWAQQAFAADPALKAAYDAAVAADPELAKSVDAKRDWLYKHHPAADERWNLVPVYRRPLMR